MLTISRSNQQKTGVLKAFLNKEAEEQLKAFFEKVEANTSLQEKLKAAPDAEAVVEIAKEAGFMISADDINFVIEYEGFYMI